MPKDGLRRLPDHVVAPLLRALMCIPRRPESRLILRRVPEPRRPFFTRDDYDVIWRGQTVGRIDCELEPYPIHKDAPWRWFMTDPGDGSGGVNDARTRAANGRAATLESAMAAVRTAWDAATKSGAA
jgi:hypothetical protein